MLAAAEDLLHLIYRRNIPQAFFFQRQRKLYCVTAELAKVMFKKIERSPVFDPPVTCINMVTVGKNW